MTINLIKPKKSKRSANASGVEATAAFATCVRFGQDTMHVHLSDGREISVPLEWFPRLRNASDEQRGNWRLIGRGVGIHWPDIDEDISVAGLLGH
jgi:hypothetical protein